MFVLPILTKNFNNASDFEKKYITTCQIANQIFFVSSDFETKNFRPIRLWSCFFWEIKFWKRKVFENQFLGFIFLISVFKGEFTWTKSCLDSIFYVKTANVSLFVFPQKAWFWSKAFHWKKILKIFFWWKNQILTWDVNNVSDFDVKSVCPVRFWLKIL